MKTVVRFLVMSVLVMFISSAHAVVRYVKPSGTGNGSSWTNAADNIQAMINASSSGDSVWIAGGTYNLTATLIMKEGVNVYGGFSGSEIRTSQRIRSDINGNGVVEAWEYTPATVLNGEDAIQVLKQLTAFTVETIWNGVTITGGTNTEGGGAYIRTNGALVNCVISENMASNAGGGVYNAGGRMTFCKISKNSVTTSATARGGGVYNIAGAITNCYISENTATSPTSSYGGGIYDTSLLITDTSRLTNVLIVKNQASDGGGLNTCANAILTNVTISGNASTSFGGGVLLVSTSKLTIQNSIVWGNTETGNISNIASLGSTPTYQSCLIGGASISGGIILNGNPLFVDATAGNYQLQVYSPAIDAANPAYLIGINTDLNNTNRIYGLNPDLGPYELQEFLPNPIHFAPLTFTYNGSEQAPTATTTSGQFTNNEYKVKNAPDNTYTSTKPINVGIYTMKAYMPPIMIYEPNTDSTDFEILRRNITVSAISDTSYYGDNPTNQGLIATNLAPGETESVLTGLSTDITINATTPVGTYTISVLGTLTNDNYEITAAYGTGTWVVIERPLTIKANDTTIDYGQTPKLDYEIVSGNLVNGDTLSGNLLVKKNGIPSPKPYAVGTHDIVQGTLTAGSNYTITFENGILKVNSVGDTIKEIIVDGKSAQRNDNQFFITAECGYDQVLVNVICANPDIRIIINGEEENPSTVNLPNFGSNQISIDLIPLDDITRTHTLIVQKLIPFDQVVITRWNNTLTVINNPANNGGLQFTSFKWFRNNKEICTEQSWSVSPNGDYINPIDEFYVELTADGYSEVLRTCKSKITLKDIDVMYSPNPTNSTLLLQSYPLRIDDIQIFDILGKELIRVANINNYQTTLNVETLHNGIYVLKITTEDGTQQMKKFVKQR